MESETKVRLVSEVIKNGFVVLSLIVGCTWFVLNYERRLDLLDGSVAQIKLDIQEIKIESEKENQKQDEENYRFQQTIKEALLRMEDKMEKVYLMQMSKTNGE